MVLNVTGWSWWILVNVRTIFVAGGIARMARSVVETWEGSGKVWVGARCEVGDTLM